MIRLSSTIFYSLAATSLCSCTLESFDVEVCQLGDAIGFKILPIDGLLRDYQPRPNEVYVRISNSQPYKEAVVWATRLSYDSFDNRTTREIIPYGQKISGWEVQHSPKPLSEGIRYYVSISDGGHDGLVHFEVGKQLPACRLSGS